MNSKYSRLIDEVGNRCELCGSKRNVEVHHIIPKICGINGIDLECDDNLIVVCSTCHGKLTPRSILTKWGIKKSGKQIGLTKGTKLTTKKSIEAKKKILELSCFFEGNMTDAQLIHKLDISRNSFYKYKRELKEDYRYGS